MSRSLGIGRVYGKVLAICTSDSNNIKNIKRPAKLETANSKVLVKLQIERNRANLFLAVHGIVVKHPT